MGSWKCCKTLFSFSHVHYKYRYKKIFLLLFADDAVLFAENPLSLQLLLNDVEKYCKAWRLKINTNKTKVKVFENVYGFTRHACLVCFLPSVVLLSQMHLLGTGGSV